MSRGYAIIPRMNRIEKAEALFTGGCNCAQAVFAAFADEFGMDEELAKRLATGLGGGGCVLSGREGVAGRKSDVLRLGA